MHPIRQQLRDRRHRTTGIRRVAAVVRWDGHHNHTSFFRQWVRDTVCERYTTPPLCRVGSGMEARHKPIRKPLNTLASLTICDENEDQPGNCHESAQHTRDTIDLVGLPEFVVCHE